MSQPPETVVLDHGTLYIIKYSFLIRLTPDDVLCSSLQSTFYLHDNIPPHRSVTGRDATSHSQLVEDLSQRRAGAEGRDPHVSQGMYGLLGPNGAGKSTLMRILATLQEADEGSVHLGEIDVLHQKDEVRKTLGYLPQEFGVYPKVSAEEPARSLRHPQGHRRAASAQRGGRGAAPADEPVGRPQQKLGGYSGGMRQRFGVAVALLGNPKLMIVDEPTAGLDPAERVRFLNLLSELGENSVVLLSTHIVEDVSELCTRMAIIDEGEILLEAEPLRAIDGAPRPDLEPRDFERSSRRWNESTR